MADNGPKTGGEVRERTRTRTKEPSMWKVVLLNDDYTPMEFVVHLRSTTRGRPRPTAS
jgi:ATP-dependent Clp protease adaptor protein ClpS